MKASPITVPLHFLPAFELVARHLSIRHAAADLHLTPSAVSQQVRALEKALGFALFRRGTRAIHLTEAGRQYADVVAQTLETYRRGADRLQRQRGTQSLRLSCDAYVAHEILIPELASFRALHPQLELRIETSAALADFERDDVDAAVRYGRGPWPGVLGTSLCKVEATPVCAPGLIPGDRLRSPSSLARYPLIAMRDYPDSWKVAEKLMGIALPPDRLWFDSYFACLRAAEKGLGIALAMFPLATTAVLEQRLVTPVRVRVWARASMRFVSRKEDARSPAIGALRSWLEQKFSALPALPPQGPSGSLVLHEP